MARFLLSFFGAVSLLIGSLSLVLGLLLALNDQLIGLGICLLISGAILLGFVRLLDLLEQIAENTKPTVAASPSADRRRQGIEPAMTEFNEGLGALLRQDRPAPPR